MSRKKSTIDDFFSKRLRSLIDNFGVSQVMFSKNIGISQSYLSAVLKGKRGASAELIAGLYIYYSEYMYWLLTGEGEMTKTPEKESGVAEDTPIYKEDNTETIGLLSMTREILKSNTYYSASLAANIRSFHHAMKTENRLNGMESRLAELESERKKSNHFKKETVSTENEGSIKKRAI